MMANTSERLCSWAVVKDTSQCSRIKKGSIGSYQKSWKSDSREARAHPNYQVKCSSSFLFICRGSGRKSVRLQRVETWSLPKKHEVDCEVMPYWPRLNETALYCSREGRVWLPLLQRLPSSSSYLFFLPPTAIKPSGPAVPFGPLISCCQGGSHIVHLLNTLLPEPDWKRSGRGSGVVNKHLLENFNDLYVKDFNQGTSEINGSNANSPDHKDFHNSIANFTVANEDELVIVCCKGSSRAAGRVIILP